MKPLLAALLPAFLLLASPCSAAQDADPSAAASTDPISVPSASPGDDIEDDSVNKEGDGSQDGAEGELDIERVLFEGPPSISQRLEEEGSGRDNRFALVAHRPSYLIPLSYNFQADDTSFAASGYDASIDSLEMAFQISLKVPMWNEPLGDDTQLSFGYTQRAWWQAYNSEVSRPFRETNHEPEVMLDVINDFEILGFTNRVIRFGINHQSNGRAEPFSRSWNRLYTEFLLERGRFAISFKPWVRIPERAEDDDNPDIDEYMGHFELRLGWRNGDNNFTLMLRNHTESKGAHGAAELTYSYALSPKARGYVQIFNGYGESLIDYNRSVTRLGIGIQLTDWL
ncbi:MAG: phospholipase A [Gammaproteobacteria bacterium]|nr:phospholipase A [Gammaproteobacteria bacterium]